MEQKILNGQNSVATSANEKNFNGFNSQEQYDAVMNVLEGLADVCDAEYDADSNIISVDGGSFSCDVAYGGWVINIWLDDVNNFEDVMGIYDNTNEIWDAFEQYQEEEVNA